MIFPYKKVPQNFLGFPVARLSYIAHFVLSKVLRSGSGIANVTEELPPTSETVEVERTSPTLNIIAAILHEVS